MDVLKTLILIGCAFAYAVANEEVADRVRRQSGLNGAHTDAMRASSQGGFVTSYNSMSNPKGFGGRVGAGYGTNVWSSGNRNVGVGGAIRSDVGINNGRPFAGRPEVGVGATYNRGANSFSLGGGRAFGSRPSNQVAFTFSRKFKRSVEDEVNDDDHQSLPDDFETQPNIEKYDDQELFSEVFHESDEENHGKRIRRQAMNSATSNSLSNKPVGRPQFSYQIDGAGNNRGNFGASGSVGAGVKAWERGPHSVGVGVGASGDLARVNGKTFTGNHQVGAGVGYQNGRFSATVGAGRTLGRFPSNHYGVNVGYRFRRSVDDEVNDDDNQSLPDESETQPNVEKYDDQELTSEVVDKSDEETQGKRTRRQAMNSATSNSLSNKPVGRPQFSYQIDGAGNNRRNFGASGSVGAGVKAWERGPHSVGVGVGASGDLARVNGKTFTGNHQVGAGVGYQNGRFSATVGAGRTLGRFPSNHYGVNVGYRFRRSVEDEVNDDDHQSLPDESQPNVEKYDDQELTSEVVDESDEENQGKRTRRQAMNSATSNSLSNKPVGRPQFSYQIDGAGNNRGNFGASGSVGAGVKAWERGPHSVGVGVGASGDLARVNGKTYTGNHQVGAGVGYQNGRFSATVGAGRTLGRFPSNHYGVNVGYRFRRSVEEDEINE